MKREKLAVGFQASWLSFLLALGAVGAMVTGLELNGEHFLRLALLWAAVCAFTALLSQVRFGGWVLLAGVVSSLVWAARSEACLKQTLDMLCKISNYYDNAYGWGFLRSPTMGRGPMDIPLGLLGGWIALVNCRSLCRGKGGLLPLLLAALPLMACVVVTDTVPHSRYLFLWLLAFVLILLTRDVRRENRRWGVKVVRLAALPTALALGLLFWAVPREGYDKQPEELADKMTQWFQSLPDKWEQLSQEVGSVVDGTIQPETLRLDTLGPRIQRVYPVMEVTAPVSGAVYLRGQHYDTYTGTGWTVSDSRELFESPENSRELGTITISTRSVRDVAYLPYYPGEAVNLFDGSIENTPRAKVYSYTQRGLYSQWRDVVAERASLRVSSLQRENAEAANLELPQDTYAWASMVVDTILRGETTATAAADAIAAYVRNSARYDLDTPKMNRDSGDFARWFLQESDTGYCVHFATLATVLLRAAGVEARYVEGYMFTAEMGRETTVTADQAHAWAEYYEPLLDAWIVLEATPADVSGETQTETPETEADIPTETTEAPATGPEEETLPPRENTPDTPVTPGEDAPEKTPLDFSWLWRLLRWVLTPILAFLAVEGQRRLRLRRRAEQRRKGSGNQRALHIWRELEGLHRLLKTQPPEEARAIALKAKYSPHAISREELAELEAARTAALEEMGKRPWYLKILDRYIFAAY